jgi:acyl-CoA thioester hydrolase
MVKEHETPIRVRYAETDAMGYLHHSVYAVYFEIGRTELFRINGGNYRAFEEQGLFFVVVQLNCKYHLPARFDDLLTLKTRVARVTPAKLEHEYEVWRDGKLLTSAHSVVACIDRAGAVQRMASVLPYMHEPG